jgi:hypothetical protein
MQPKTTTEPNMNHDTPPESAEAARRWRAHRLVEIAKADYLAAPFDPNKSVIDTAIAYRFAVRQAKLADEEFARAERLKAEQQAEGEDRRLAELLAEFDAQQDRS